MLRIYSFYVSFIHLCLYPCFFLYLSLAMFKILLLGYCCYVIFAVFSLVCLFGVWVFRFCLFICFLVRRWSWKFCVISDNGGHDHGTLSDWNFSHPLMIPRDLEVLSDAFHRSVESKQSGWKISVTEFL